MSRASLEAVAKWSAASLACANKNAFGKARFRPVAMNTVEKIAGSRSHHRVLNEGLGLLQDKACLEVSGDSRRGHCGLLGGSFTKKRKGWSGEGGAFGAWEGEAWGAERGSEVLGLELGWSML